MKRYVDGFVLVVPKKNIQAYRRMAEAAGKVFKKHGALQYAECIGDDLKPVNGILAFPKMVKPRAGEVILFSWILYRSKAHRNAVNKKAIKDPQMNESCNSKKMPFDPKRMAYAGFSSIVYM